MPKIPKAQLATACKDGRNIYCCGTSCSSNECGMHFPQELAFNKSHSACPTCGWAQCGWCARDGSKCRNSKKAHTLTMNELILKYVDILRTHGPDSPEAKQLRRDNAESAEFLRVADDLDNLKTPVSPEEVEYIAKSIVKALMPPEEPYKIFKITPMQAICVWLGSTVLMIVLIYFIMKATIS